MSRNFLLFFIGLILFLSPKTEAQSYSATHQITIEGYLNPFAGGLNAVQVSTTDLNNDALPDLVIFDKTTSKVTTFLRTDTFYVHAPDYENLFPKIDGFLHLADYDLDGLKDIFSFSQDGLIVYQHKGFIQNIPSWQTNPTLVRTTLFNNRSTPLIVNFTDIPAIIDIDKDGDLDVFTYIPTVGGRIEYHKNISMEQQGTAGLVFSKVTDFWGNFEECGNCQTYLFNGSSCTAALRLPEGERIAHAGSAITILPISTDTLFDVLIGEISCEHLLLLPNAGNRDTTFFTSYQTAFPPASPVKMKYFPAAFHEDIDQDGKKDLIVSSNLYTNEGNQVDFAHSVWYYRNVGTALPDFQLVNKDFLQNQMLDVGENAVPAFADLDGDGDTDMVVGNKGRQGTNGLTATLFLFENIGTQNSPRFRLVNDDFLSLMTQGYTEIKPTFADLNADGRIDIAFSARLKNTSTTVIKYIFNLGNSPAIDFSADTLKTLNGISNNVGDEPCFFDIDKDGNMDLLLGKLSGALEYYRNIGNFNFIAVNKFFGGLVPTTQRRELSITVADLFSDNKPDLITGGKDGKIVVYPDFQQYTNGLFYGEYNLTYQNKLNGNTTDWYLGTGIYPRVYNKKYLFVGGVGGGIFTFERDTTITALAVFQAIEQGIQLYPNPANQTVTLTAHKPFTAKIFTTEGLFVTEIASEQSLTIDTQRWNQGIYIIAFTIENNIFYKKLLIQH
jgi:hypothetical protein